MVNVATIHPAPKVHTATIPVNADYSADAVRAIRETLAEAGRTLVGWGLASRGPAVHPSKAAITFPGASECLSIRVEYVKAVA